MYVKRHEQFEIGCGAILNKYIKIIIKYLCEIIMFLYRTHQMHIIINLTVTFVTGQN